MTASPTTALSRQWRGHQPLPAEAITDFRARHPGVAEAWRSTYAELDRILAAQDPWRGYSYWGPAAARLTAGVDDAWLCGFLMWNIDRFDTRFEQFGLDPEFYCHFIDSFHRIADQIAADPSFVHRKRDVFLKDLGITRCTLIPAAARLLYPYTGLSVSQLLGNPGALPYVYGRCGGRRPFFGLHVHQPMAAAYFNPAGWAECHRLARLALAAFPQVRGLMGASWFYDPAAAEVSPHLAYLLEAPLHGGARLLRLGESPDFTRDAIAASRTRRAAYEAGAYKPTGYALLWSRKDLEASA
jgi:hypothetical protein